MAKVFSRPRGGVKKIPPNVKDFAKITYKKYKKEWRDEFDSKKALRRNYFDQLLVDLPDVIEWLLYNSYKQNDEIKEIVSACYVKFIGGSDGPEFIEYITDIVKKFGVEDIPNIEYFPIILGELIAEILKANKEREESGETALEGPDDLYKLSTKILSKRLKKAAKKGIPDDIAFDILSVVPTKDALRYGQYSRAKKMLDILYIHAKNTAIPVSLVMKTFVNAEYYKFIIGYALQERKDKYRELNEIQKKFFNDLTTWCFDQMEEMSKAEIREIINSYINVRKRDAANGKDSNRRYYISSLPKSDYPTIMNVVENMISQNAGNKKFL